jgi:molybdate transport system regulatory protein
MTEPRIPEFGIKHMTRSGHEPETGIVVKTKVWLEKDGKLLMGWGRATLLERIDQLGSISAAAKSMKLAYRNAWLWINAMNHLAPSPLVERVTGGFGGGNTMLTEEGRRAIAMYRELRSRLAELLKPEALPSR